MARVPKSMGAVAPKERINISYKPATGSAKEGVELPFKLLVLGKFVNRHQGGSIEERDVTNINKQNFDTVLERMDLSLDLQVENKITGQGTLDVHLDIDSLSRLEPDQIVESVPELRELTKLREALKALKGPLGNSPAMRHKIRELMHDDAAIEQVKKEISNISAQQSTQTEQDKGE